MPCSFTSFSLEALGVMPELTQATADMDWMLPTDVQGMYLPFSCSSHYSFVSQTKPFLSFLVEEMS